MPLESLGALLKDARKHNYALGYFESWNLESLAGVVDAAEMSRSPVILGFSGDFLTRPERLAAERIAWYGQLGLAAAQSARVPCGLIFNECPIDDCVRQAMACGFNIVSMNGKATEEYAFRVGQIVAAAHGLGIGVEAEAGELPCGAAGSEQSGQATTPEAAAKFVEATGVDMLAVSVGNVHILTRGAKGLDLPLVEAIARRAGAPLVLHGGTGIDPRDLRAAISLGVRKVNYGTVLKQRSLQAIRKALAVEQDNPHRALGMGGSDDLMVATRQAVREAVLERIEHLGCAGRG